MTPVTPAALPDVATASAPAQALLPDFRACIDQLRVGPWQAGLPVALASVATGAFAQGVPLRPALETAAVAPATVPAPVATPPHPVPASAPALPAIAPAALVDWLAAGEHAVQAWLPARAPAPTLPPASAPAPGLGSAPAAPVAVPADSSDSAQLQAEAMRALPYAHEAMMSASAWLVIGAWRVDATPADIPLTTP